jgi:NAD+ diphosphatase
MSMMDFANFHYCPRCGGQELAVNDEKSMVCGSCGYLYYHGTHAAAVGILQYEKDIILTRRANEPKKGMLSLPGGFVDYGECLEMALIREIREELNLDISEPVYLCSQGEQYASKDVVYFCVVTFFVVRVEDIHNIRAQDDVESYQLFSAGEINGTEMAFESDLKALEEYTKFNYHAE